MPLHLFFDTTELSTWRILNPALGSLITETNSRAFVSSLCLEELACQKLRELRSSLDKARREIEIASPCGQVPLGPSPDDDELLAAIRADIQNKKPTWLTEIPIDNSVSLSTLLGWSTRRRRPFRRDKDPTGFHDAVIFLSYLNYAKAYSLDPCHLVSTNTADFPKDHVQEVGLQFGNTWDVLLGTAMALAFIRDPELSLAVARAFDNPALVVGYVQQHLISAMLATAADAVGDREHIPTVRDLEVKSINAVLEQPDPTANPAGVQLQVDVRLTVEGLEALHMSGVTIRREDPYTVSFLLDGRGAIDVVDRKVSGPPHIVGLGISAIDQG